MALGPDLLFIAVQTVLSWSPSTRFFRSCYTHLWLSFTSTCLPQIRRGDPRKSSTVLSRKVSPFSSVSSRTRSAVPAESNHTRYLVVGIPLALAMALRGIFTLLRLLKFYQNKFLPAIAPLSLISLLFAIVIIFAGQGKQVVQSITSVLRILPPLFIYFVGSFVFTLWGCKRFGSSYKRSSVHAFTNS